MEKLEIYDTSLKPIGIVSRQEAHQKNLLHAVIHLWVIDLNRQVIYFQRRSLNKEQYPGYYDITCAGHIAYPETLEQALFREAREEIGLTLKKENLTFLGCQLERFPNQQELAYVYIYNCQAPHFHLGDEVDAILEISIHAFLSEQTPYIMEDQNHDIHLISQKQLSPHHYDWLKEQLRRHLLEKNDEGKHFHSVF